MADTKFLFRTIFEQSNIYRAPSRETLRRAVVACFNLPNISLAVEEKAFAIVEALYNVDLVLDKKEQKIIVTELLYTIYYEEMVATEDVWFLLLQIAAAKGCSITVQSALESMSTQEKVRFVAFLFSHYCEGSWPLLTLFQKQAQLDFKELIEGLMQNYFALEHLQEAIAKGRWSLETVVQELTILAEQEAKECFSLLSTLIPQVYNAMLKVYEQVGENDAKIAVHKKQFLHIFGSYFAKPFTMEEFLAFARLFGLKAYPPLFAAEPNEPNSLKAKLALCTHEVVQKNAALVHSFLSSILCHIMAMRENKMISLDLVTCSIATSGKDLRNLASLPSILEGYRRIGATLLDHPIFVFDQSEPELLRQNRLFITHLNKTYSSAIASISKEEALALAKRLNLEPLINTTKTGSFGYGGARNCQYLLTGVLKTAYSCGIQSIQELLAVEDALLFSFFSTNVLKSEMSLLLVDDDMQLAPGALFSSALLAKQISSCYSSASGFQYGRETKTVYGACDLAALLQGSQSPFPRWSDIGTPSGIAEYTCKPKICLNLPHGCEEAHLWLSCKTHFYLQPARHLSGSRYPSTQIPTSPFVGLEEYIKNSLTNELLIGMISTLVDPQNSFGMCILPWNDSTYHDTITCLQDALEVMAHKATQKELQRRFLQNIRQFFANTCQNAYYKALHHLMQLDVDLTIEQFTKQHPPLASGERASLNALGRLYKQTQQDARHFWQFGQLLAQVESCEKLTAAVEEAYNQQLASTPLYQGFYLLCCSLAKGEFCEAVAKIVQQTKK